jgi:WD40 repeat protein
VGREGEIAAIGVDPGGLRVCAATFGHLVDMWETGTHRESTVLEGAAPRARQALINDAHTRLATVDSEGVIRIWDLERGRLRIVMQDLGDVHAIAQDERFFLAAATDGTVRVWDLQRDGPEHAQLTMLSADQRRLYVARTDHTIEVREFAVADSDSRRLEGRVESVCAMASHEKGNLFFAADLDRTVQSWRIDSGERYRALGGMDAPVTALLYLPEIDRLLTGSLNGAVRSWDWKRRLKSTLRQPEEGDSPICRLAATESGEAVFAVDRIGTLFGWNQLSGKPILKPVEAGGPVVMLAVSPSGTRIAVALEDGRLLNWTSASGELQNATELPVGATPLAMRCSDFGAITWRSLDGRAWKWIVKGPPVERQGLDQIPTGGAGLPWVLRDPLRRLVVAESRSGLMMEEFRAVAVPAERYDPRPTRLVPWSR